MPFEKIFRPEPTLDMNEPLARRESALFEDDRSTFSTRNDAVRRTPRRFLDGIWCCSKALEALSQWEMALFEERQGVVSTGFGLVRRRSRHLRDGKMVWWKLHEADAQRESGLVKRECGASRREADVATIFAREVHRDAIRAHPNADRFCWLTRARDDVIRPASVCRQFNTEEWVRRTLPVAMCNPPSSSLPTRQSKDAPWLLDVELPLECITPVIGGGVESFHPDEIDVVRVPALRGQLRFWWRACQTALSELCAMPNLTTSQALFLREARTWGGVSVPSTNENDLTAWKSRVRISVEIIHRGQSVPAGRHELTTDGRLRAMPKWTRPALGYALFPLQRSSDELRDHERDGKALDTQHVREGVAFKLRLQLAALTEGEEDRKNLGKAFPSYDKSDECNQLLAALWAFVHLGGLGARTRRGFGALAPGALHKHSIHNELNDCFDKWARLFTAPAISQVVDRFDDFMKLAGMHQPSLGGHGLPSWPVLHGSITRAYGPHSKGVDAQAWLVDKLQTFRQGRDVGRNPGDRSRPGRSRWPEADWLKRLVDEKAKQNNKSSHRWKHPPAPLDRKDQREPVAPRTAFGLPIVVSFKDNEDKPANAQLFPTERGGRWASPLILRPIRCAQGQYVPIAFAFDRRPGRGALRDMRVYVQNSDQTLNASGYAGAASPIREYLGTRDVDAVEAFFEFLAKGREGGA